MAQNIDSSPRQAQLYELTGNRVEFDIIVNEDGHVESATVTKGPAEYADQARQVELARTFKPWLRAGSPIRVKFSDDVSVLPPERWAAVHVPFPDPIDWSTATVQLERTRCYGSCPAYKVSVSADGTVRFSAVGGWGGVQIPGDHTAHIAPSAARNLILDFKRADFLSANDNYTASVTDNPTNTLTLQINGRTKTVVDYVGTSVGMPQAIEDLEDEIDTVADTDRWIVGNDRTMASLDAEHWPFASSSPQNLALYVEAVSSGNQPLIERFLAARTPAVSPDPRLTSPVCVASKQGAMGLISRMVPRDAEGKPLPIPTQVATQCLWLAAGSGSVETLQYWLDRGADWKTPTVDTQQPVSVNQSLLAAGILSGRANMVRRLLDLKPDLHAMDDDGGILAFAIRRDGVKEMPEIVKMLIDAGANVNARNEDGETPIFAAMWYPDILPLLAASGADLEAKANYGETALTRDAFLEDYVRVMLSLGANPAAVADNGDTPLKAARKYQCAKCAAMIADALKQRGLDVPPPSTQ